jgi:mannitol-specific phosphotransferase system IIBC component
VGGRTQAGWSPAGHYPGGVKEFAVYTAARLGLFAVSYALVIGVYLLVSGGRQVPLFWPFLLAIVISAVASALLLRGQRDRFAQVVQRRAERASSRLEEMRSAEDEPGS